MDGPISGKSIALDAMTMIVQGKEIALTHKNMIVKIPMIQDELKAVNILSKEGIKTNITLIFTAGQALPFCKDRGCLCKSLFWKTR